MKYNIKAYSIWEFGKRKDAQGNPHQEDSLFPAHEALSASDRLFILCDGMGGHDAGEVASETVCDSMSRHILEHCPDPEGEFTDRDFHDALAAAYDALDAVDNGAPKKMGTTMTFLKLHENGATVAHIGDSRVYHIRPGKNGEETKILHVTEDHSLVNQLVKIGEMTPEEARNSNRKNVITRAMQPHQESRCPADIHHITDIRPGDYFYMCSDGMLEQEGMENGTSLRNIFSEQGGDDLNKISILINATHDNSDNHTAIIVHITDVEGVVEKNLPSFDAIVSETPVPPIATRQPSGNRVKAAARSHRNNNIFFWIFIIAAVAVALYVFVLPMLRHESTPADPKPAVELDDKRNQDISSQPDKGQKVEPKAPVAPEQQQQSQQQPQADKTEPGNTIEMQAITDKLKETIVHEDREDGDDKMEDKTTEEKDAQTLGQTPVEHLVNNISNS